MNRRNFISKAAFGTAAAGTGMVLYDRNYRRKAEAVVLELYILGGLVVVGTGVYVGWKLYKLAKNKLYPPPVPPDGATNRPPTMPPGTNSPPAHMPARPTSMLHADDGGLIYPVADDADLVLPNSDPVLLYSSTEFQSSTNLVAWRHVTTVTVWAGSKACVVQTESDVQWCGNRADITVDASAGYNPGPGEKFFRIRPA